MKIIAFFKNLISFFPRKVKTLKGVVKDIRYIKNVTISELNDLNTLMKVFITTSSNIPPFLRSQYSQDMIAYLFLKTNMKKEKGFYIDIGAHDGVTLSNTYLFEQIGWKGICVEPIPDIFIQLQKNRTCDVINAAITDKLCNSADFIQVSGPDMLSGLDSEMSSSHKKRIKAENGSVEVIKVKTLTFDAIMQNYPEINHIDFLSIDVEGGEMNILQTINFKKYSFGIITIENNEPDNKLTVFMKNHEYCEFCKTGCDIMFIKQ